MPEEKDLYQVINILSKCIIHLDECNDIQLGQEVFVIVGDIIIFNEIVDKDNINKAKKYICDGYVYHVKE